ncbi:MAG TPA: hypothetical protein VMR50_03115 [Myxococcota bacterium]|nr:hypothetical protein [Myxococcota bacterium]
MIYPAKGQSADQQAKDQTECQGWAKSNTGVDPVAIANAAGQPAPVAAAPPPQSGQRVRGAAKGAAAGAAVGAISGGDAGKGAAAGAVAGTAVAGSRQRRAERAAAGANQQAQQQQASDTQAKMATYNKAYSACLEGKGYTVK